MSLILNIETATEVCSICLAKNGKVVAIAESEEPQKHASQVTLLIERVMEATETSLADLDAVAVSSGPGSYTGLRIGASTAKGICFALGLPMISVDTLAALAKAAMKEVGKEAYYIPMIDARRMEVYTSVYKFQEKTPIEKNYAKIISSDSFANYLTEGKSIFLCGNGAPKCMEMLSSPHIQLVNIGCSAAILADLSHNQFYLEDFSDLAYYTPSYLKTPKITISKKKL